MLGRGFQDLLLTNADQRRGLFLTLAFLIALTPHLSHADISSTIDNDADRQRLSDAEAYIRKQGMQGVSLLPHEVRDAFGWFQGGWHPMKLLDDDETANPDTAQAPQLTPAHTADSSGNPFNLNATVHHKGFLPTHDAMMMAVAAHKSVFDDKLQLTARPFYGQSWHSLRGYWGSEVAMNIAKRPDGLPWGTLSVGYVGGEDSMTDHGRGTELRGDVDLTNHVKFTSGVKQNSADGNSDYVMLRWKVDLD